MLNLRLFAILKIQHIQIFITIFFLMACNLGVAPMASPAPATAWPAPTATMALVSPTTGAALPADWQVYTDPTLGFSISHLPGWVICTETERSRLFCNAQAEGAGFPVFYVTVVTPDFTNEDASAYNFVAEEVVQSLAVLAVGGTFTTGDPNPDFSTFTRLPDMQVDGETGLVVENTHVWEGGPNTKDRRVFVQHADEQYQIGTYYETPPELETFEAVLASFKFEK